MKVLSKEEENAHYRAVLRGGTVGTFLGLVGGTAALLAASKRVPTIKNLTLPMKAFLVTSSGTFVGIIAADHSSRSFEASQHSEHAFLGEREARLRQEELASMSSSDRMWAFIRKEKYKIMTVSWAASMVAAWVMVSRNPTLTKGQKIVQARVYAQGLTLAVMCGTAAMEISDQRKGRGLLDKMKEKQAKTAEKENAGSKKKKERYQGEELWKDMVEAEEERLNARDAQKQKLEQQAQKH
ncbi:mitochondrial hypoxia responsive domain-containing protein [Histoplasma capsulatum var. duboisii H88]|uniref:Mitochondrial hypoxia responsive domain-containing protein n=3 Tax=Ajellomyces capsulatus TaxID=5037 RepID=C0NJ67_AJECG|nr:mitochondrial hypoxia responsive domain-containing protein [Histoplasma capsulatum G186AR]EEH07908.1 mitochondrial hypoxia responsive domain-containing protein [Histoplasma capsulatum G186AR]EER42872.1 mitochondrial hypoxia responsive domain-containing protein [Histoplasma capsulatum H143]EGC42942.1 mitochondrial hypoxia responsive domain-containing protein [Histoplasma capsulatum var. duboisii H88]QSS49132.1 mitochondrial hypoxia responsive domain-containing protein [Histoplasma capsulatum 